MRRLSLLAVVFVLALATRATAAARVALIERDGIEYLAAAGSLARGDLRGALGHYYPPAYPAAVALFSPLAGGAPLEGPPGERAGAAASAVSGALLAALVALAASLALSRRSAVLAGLVAAVHPSSVEQGAKVTADPLFSALVLGAVASLVAAFARAGASPWRARILLALGGALAAASYLARPEGLLVLAALAATAALVRRESPAPSRLAAPVWVLLPGFLVGLGYVVAIKPDAVLTGRDAGAWKLTKKRELFLEAGGERAFPRGEDGARHLDAAGAASVAGEALARAAKQTWLAVAEGNLALGLALLGAAAVARRRDPASRALLAATGASALALLAGYALIRTDARYGAILFAFALPLVGEGLGALLELGRARPGLARVGLVALLLVHVAVAVRPRLERKRTWREAGERCRALGLDPVASVDPRVAFYAGARLVDVAPRPGRTREAGARTREIVETARARGARAIVVGGGSALELDLETREVLAPEGAEVVTLYELDSVK